MKKFLIMFLTLLLVLLPCTSFAVKLGPPNYLEGLTWNKTYSATIAETNGLYVKATSLYTSYSTPAIDIAPALKQTYYDHSMCAFVTVKISGKARADFENNASNKLSVHLIIRAKNSLPNPDTWKQQYKDSIVNDTPFFNISGTNVLKTISQDFDVTTNWSDFSATVSLTRLNVFCDLTPNWYLCFDGIDLITSPDALYVKDLKLEVVSTGNSTSYGKPTTPTPTPRPTPTAAAIPPRVTPNSMVMSTPMPTQAPVVTPKPTASPKPLEETKELFYEQPLMEDINDIISWSWKGIVIIVIIAGFFAITLNLFTRRK